MTPDPRKKTGRKHPQLGQPSDSDPTMDAASDGPSFDPRSLSVEDLRDPATAEEALAHWDELAPSVLSAIESHPHQGPRLALLRKTDRWLEKHGATLRATGDCPSSEELYDFGRGPGYGPMSHTRRVEIETHLARCEDCESLVETLSSSPPVPLVHGPHEGSDDVEQRTPAWRHAGASDDASDDRSSTRPRPRALPRLLPLAVAASLILALGVWIAIVPSGAERLAFPQSPLLRGSSGGPLFFPRGKVLRTTDALKAAFPTLDGRLVFEIEPQEEASAYTVEIARHSGDAFAAEEESLARLSSAEPAIETTPDLAPGSYTWTAHTNVRELDRVLGSRDFEVVDDAEVVRQIVELAGRQEPERTLAAVVLLHGRGYLGEARALARAMPASPEREAYLGQVPGR